jgi:hypothetical protein
MVDAPGEIFNTMKQLIFSIIIDFQWSLLTENSKDGN